MKFAAPYQGDAFKASGAQPVGPFSGMRVILPARRLDDLGTRQLEGERHAHQGGLIPNVVLYWQGAFHFRAEMSALLLRPGSSFFRWCRDVEAW